MAGYSELSQELMKLLRLRTLPVAIKLFQRRSDIPEGFQVI